LRSTTEPSLVGALDQRRDLRPRQRAVEPHADPAARGDIGRQEVAVRIAVDEHALHAVGRIAPQREPAVVVVIVGEGDELFAADKPARRVMARSLDGIGELRADRAHLCERGRHADRLRRANRSHRRECRTLSREARAARCQYRPVRSRLPAITNGGMRRT
jgi:hypothetical protein